MEKKVIMLVCIAGMSTSMLVSAMTKAAEKKHIEADIFAVSAAEANRKLESKPIDVVLLSPQVRYMQSRFEEKAAKRGIPIGIINSRDYGMLDGNNVLDTAVQLLDGGAPA